VQKTPKKNVGKIRRFFGGKNHKNMKKSACLLFFCGFAMFATAQLEYKGYSGGMFVHTGYIKSNSFNVRNSQGIVVLPEHKISNVVFGLGGKLMLQYSDYLRFGMEGYSTKATYGDHKSTYSVSWGGFSAEAFISDRMVSYFAGATLGYGQVKNLVVTKKQNKPSFQISDDILLRRYGIGIFTPYLGAEVKVSEKLRAVIKVDYAMGFFNVKDDWGKGFRVHLGMKFRSGD
jgi:hypothetical protein